MAAAGTADKRPRILQCVSHLALGGAERVTMTISEALRDEFDFHVFAVRGIADGPVGQSLARECCQLGFPVHIGIRVPMRWGGIFTSALGMAKAVARARPDILHLHTEIPEAAYALMVTIFPHLQRIPVVRTIHNSLYWGFWRSLGRWCERRMLGVPVAGVSNGALRAVRALRGEARLDDSRTGPELLIYNGVKKTLMVPGPPSMPSHGSLRLVYGGRWEHEKGTDLLPLIVPQVSLPAGVTARFTIYGSGRYRAALTSMAQKPPPGWQIDLQHPDPEFARKMEDYDIVVFPSRFEGLGLVAIEAMLANRVLVATDAPGTVEALPDGYPWVARAGDAAHFAHVLTNVLHSPGRWQQVVESARAATQKRFSVEPMAQAYRSLYLRMLPA